MDAPAGLLQSWRGDWVAHLCKCRLQQPVHASPEVCKQVDLLGQGPAVTNAPS